MHNKSIIIAVDGNSASGKGTLSAGLAKHFGFDFLDTGLLYRLLAKNVMERAIEPTDLAKVLQLADTLDFTNIPANTILHTDEISDVASQVAKLPEVRKKLDVCQRSFPLGKKGVVIDGRDIGTVIFPNADCKLYVMADLMTRAARRHSQLQKIGHHHTYDQVLNDLRLRDERDATRTACPMKQAPDAILIDTTHLNVSEVLDKAIAAVVAKISIPS